MHTVHGGKAYDMQTLNALPLGKTPHRPCHATPCMSAAVRLKWFLNEAASSRKMVMLDTVKSL